MAVEEYTDDKGEDEAEVSIGLAGEVELKTVVDEAADEECLYE